MSLKRAKLPVKWQIDQEFQRESIPPCGLRCFCFYNRFLENVGLIQVSQIAALITWIWPKNGRFAFGAALLLWVMVGFWSVWGNLALNVKIVEIVFNQ